MASPNENDEFPILVPVSEARSRANTRAFNSRNRSVSFSNSTYSTNRVDNSSVALGYTGPLRTPRRPPPSVQMSGPLYSLRRPDQTFYPPSPTQPPDSSSTVDVPSEEDEFVLKNANLLKSGQLGMCNDPYCTTCPSYYNRQAAQFHTYRVISDSRFHSALYDDARGWAKRFASSVRKCIPGIMNPHSKFDNKCIEIDWLRTKVFVSLRSMSDLIFFINILLQFRLAYVAPESRIVGAGQLVDHPRKIARNYLRGKFFLDLLIVLPMPQYIPKLYRLLPLLAGQTPTGFIFESAWANFIINLLTFILAGHAVGSFWYIAGLQRVKKCLLHAGNHMVERRNLIDCARGDIFAPEPLRALWRDSESVNACFQEGGFSYGIYSKAVNLTTQHDIFTRFSYSLFWGFQQISTLAGNQMPSYSVGEVYFTMGIIGLGLLLFARLIGNMHNFLQALDRRRVREAERFNWAATRGVNEELLFENMPDDLQRDIKRHLFKFLKKVRIFSLMDESILDAIRERLKQRTYIRSSTVLHRKGLVEKMVFIVRGEMESIGEDGYVLPLSEGDVCGEELLTWCLDRSSVNPGTSPYANSFVLDVFVTLNMLMKLADGTRIKMPAKGLVSNRNVRCVTNVEAFSLSVADLEDVTSLFSRFLRSHRVQGAIRYESPYWRLRAAMQIQVAWRYRKKRLERLLLQDSRVMKEISDVPKGYRLSWSGVVVGSGKKLDTRGSS
ncbi:hypothetical protein Bca101_083830 [Brassica carinata]